VRPALVPIGALAGIVAVSSPCFADDKAACIDAHAEGQKLVLAGRLREARARFTTCGASSCPQVLQKECSEYLAETDAKQPTIVVAAKDEGSDTASVVVYCDGAKVADKLTGTPMPVDPGEHEMRFVLPDGRAVERHLVLREREKDVVVNIAFAARPSPLQLALPPAPQRSRSLVPAYVTGGIGLASLGVSIGFDVAAWSQGNELKQTCAPDCSHDKVASMQLKGAVADITLGVAVLAAAATVWIVATRGHATSAPSSATAGAR
jgi:hypothetical protein